MDGPRAARLECLSSFYKMILGEVNRDRPQIFCGKLSLFNGCEKPSNRFVVLRCSSRLCVLCVPKNTQVIDRRGGCRTPLQEKSLGQS